MGAVERRKIVYEHQRRGGAMLTLAPYRTAGWRLP